MIIKEKCLNGRNWEGAFVKVSLFTILIEFSWKIFIPSLFVNGTQPW